MVCCCMLCYSLGWVKETRECSLFPEKPAPAPVKAAHAGYLVQRPDDRWYVRYYPAGFIRGSKGELGREGALFRFQKCQQRANEDYWNAAKQYREDGNKLGNKMKKNHTRLCISLRRINGWFNENQIVRKISDGYKQYGWLQMLHWK